MAEKLHPVLTSSRQMLQIIGMVDKLTSEQRSRLMSQVRGKDTKPELVVRRLVHSLGYRFRLHRRDLPGSPDLVFPSRRKVIFVHGCYWHRHDCKKATTPKSNTAFWQKKFDDNVMRDNKNLRDLKALGWEAMVVWQCETETNELLAHMIGQFLDSSQ